MQLNRQTLYYHSLDDVYEITIGGPETVVLLRFRHGLDTRGEIVDYDELPPIVQQGLYKLVKNYLRTQNENGSE